MFNCYFYINLKFTIVCMFHDNTTSVHDIISSTVITAKKIAFNIAKKYSYNGVQ